MERPPPPIPNPHFRDAVFSGFFLVTGVASATSTSFLRTTISSLFLSTSGSTVFFSFADLSADITSDSEIGRSSALSTFCRNAAILALAPTLTAPDAAFAFTTAAAGIVANTGACSIVFSTGTTGVSTDVDSCEDCISWAIGRSSISLSYK